MKLYARTHSVFLDYYSNTQGCILGNIQLITPVVHSKILGNTLYRMLPDVFIAEFHPLLA